MNNFFSILFFLISCNIASAQFAEEQIIESCGWGCIFGQVLSFDLDLDGDMDVLSAKTGEAKIVWYENDGLGNFLKEHTITNKDNSIADIYASDLDADGDIDVLLGSWSGRLVWYANDGTGNFSEEFVIYQNMSGIEDIYVSDLDGDLDMDVLTTFSHKQFSYTIRWYENDGVGNFSERIVNDEEGERIESIYADDLDHDGDADVVVGAFEGTVAWYENDGLGNFSKQHIIYKEAGVLHVYAFDLNSDSHIDVLSSSGNGIVWYKNDGMGNFSERDIIHSSGTEGLYASDLDSDGDIDILSTSVYDRVAWYENDGSGHFMDKKYISSGTKAGVSVYAVDLDNDEDIDVLATSAAVGLDEITWYENTGMMTTLTNDFPISSFVKISPNPINDFLLIERESFPNELVTFCIFDVRGRKLKTIYLQEATQQISTASLANGLYFFEMINLDGQIISSGKLVK